MHKKKLFSQTYSCNVSEAKNGLFKGVSSGTSVIGLEGHPLKVYSEESQRKIDVTGLSRYTEESFYIMGRFEAHLICARVYCTYVLLTKPSSLAFFPDIGGVIPQKRDLLRE